MRKYLAVLGCLLVAGALYAQRLVDNWPREEALSRLSDTFYIQLENSFRKQNSVMQKPWQAALFLGTELRPTEETLQVLKEQIGRGNLQRAAVLSFAAQGTDAPGTAYLYVLNTQQARPQTRTFPPDTPLPVLVDALFAQLQNSPDLYTALIINARGNGLTMRYAGEQPLLLSDFTRPLAARRLQIDVLDLQACRMGSAYGLEQLVENRRIHYAIVSSQLRRGSPDVMYYRLLNHFDKTPREAALAAHREFAQVVDFSKDRSTHNSLVLDLSRLYEPFEKWHARPVSLLTEPGWSSFNKWLEKQHTPQATDLAEALRAALLSQWCYSSKTHTLYSENIPAESDCIDGVSVNWQVLSAL